MAQYVKSTNFASKDSLPLGDPAKIVKGTEIDTEFNNIAVAVATKADTLSPALTGAPTAPTAVAGTNTTQLATTAFVQAALQALYPVGSVYINATVDTNPATLLGFGTWVTVGDGKVLVNQDTTDTSFDVLGETGGSKDAIVVSHSHTGTTATDGAHAHTVPFRYGTYTAPGGEPAGSAGGSLTTVNTSTAGTHSHTFTTNSTGSSGTNANLQPYVVVRMWKRTA